jgi:hypothetical protein
VRNKSVKKPWEHTSIPGWEKAFQSLFQRVPSSKDAGEEREKKREK